MTSKGDFKEDFKEDFSVHTCCDIQKLFFRFRVCDFQNEKISQISHCAVFTKIVDEVA